MAMTPPVRPPPRPRRGSGKAEHVPVMWVLPRDDTTPARLALWLCGGNAGMNASGSELEALAETGLVGLSFDSWHRGSRAPESNAEQFKRLRANYPQVAWPLIGNAALEVLRVLDWAAAEFGAGPPFCVGGHDLGGDIAIAAAGLDARIGRVAAITASPDWRRPGMRIAGQDVDPGGPDAYAQWFFDRLDPLTHVGSFSHRPAIALECGADDEHAPPDGALRFRDALLAGPYADAPERLRVTVHAGVRHEYTPAMWAACLAWFGQ